jgi:hypothetical protein
MKHLAALPCSVIAVLQSIAREELTIIKHQAQELLQSSSWVHSQETIASTISQKQVNNDSSTVATHVSY